MSIYQTENGWGVDYLDEWKNRVRRFVGSQEAAVALDAQLRQSKAQTARAAQQFASGETLTLADALALYHSHTRLQENTRQVQADYLKMLRRAIGDRPITQVTPAIAQAYIDARRQVLASRSLHDQVKFLSNLFGWLTAEGYLLADPFKDKAGKKTRRHAAPRAELRRRSAGARRARQARHPLQIPSRRRRRTAQGRPALVAQEQL